MYNIEKDRTGMSQKLYSLEIKGVYVVAQLYPWIKFCFPLFLGVVMYDNEFETKENKI